MCCMSLEALADREDRVSTSFGESLCDRGASYANTRRGEVIPSKKMGIVWANTDK